MSRLPFIACFLLTATAVMAGLGATGYPHAVRALKLLVAEGKR